MSGEAAPGSALGQRWSLTLYVSGASPLSMEAIENLRRVCDDELADRVDLDIVTASDHPDLVLRDHVLALPTLVKHAPAPAVHLVGNLADEHRLRTGLDLPARTAPPALDGGS